MVEKIDRPETPPAYQILPAKEAKDDQSRKQEYEEGDERYQKEKSLSDWGKFRGREMTVKPVRVPRDRIAKVLFKTIALRSGIAIMETTVVWKDGRTTDSALFLIPRTEDYMKLRFMKRGQEVAESFWAKGPEIEMGIVQLEPGSGSWRTKELGVKAGEQKRAKKRSKLSSIGLVDDATGKFQWTMLAVYLVGIAVIVLAIVFAVR